jgi:hypothetical protein
MYVAGIRRELHRDQEHRIPSLRRPIISRSTQFSAQIKVNGGVALPTLSKSDSLLLSL